MSYIRDIRYGQTMKRVDRSYKRYFRYGQTMWRVDKYVLYKVEIKHQNSCL